MVQGGKNTWDGAGVGLIGCGGVSWVGQVMLRLGEVRCDVNGRATQHSH